MSNLPAPGRRYSEKEVSRLLKRTAELQRASPNSPNARGLSLNELEEIAAEAGLDITLLRQAATELETASGGASGLGDRLAGGPMSIVIERTLPREADESAYEAIVARIQIAATTPGTASQIGRTFTWQGQTQNATQQLSVVITARNGETRVRIEEKHGTLAGALFGGGLAGSSGLAIAGGAIAGSTGGVALAIAVPILVVGGAYTTFRTIFSRKSKQRRRVLTELMENIVAELDTSGRHEAG